MTLANRLDPDQARRKRRARSGPKLFDTLIVFVKFAFEKIDFENLSKTKIKQNYPPGKELAISIQAHIVERLNIVTH